MGTIQTNAVQAAFRGPNQRKLDRTQSGILWACYFDNGILRLAYSQDNGTTWTSGGTIATLSGNYAQDPCLFIDLDDYAHVVYKDGNNNFLYYVRGTPNAGRTAFTFPAVTALYTADANGQYPVVVAHRDVATAGAWVAHIVYARTSSGASNAHYNRILIAANGTLTFFQAANVSGINMRDTNYSGSVNTYPVIDFKNTGDGKTVFGTTPDLYVTWTASTTGSGSGIRFRQAVYGGGTTWTWNAEREIDTTVYHNDQYGHTVMFDGTRVVITGWGLNASGLYIAWLHDRDPADPASGGTTLRYPFGTNVAAIDTLLYGSFGYDKNANIYFFGIEVSNQSPNRIIGYRKWNRASNTLDSRVVIDATSDTGYITARRGYNFGGIDYAWADQPSPFTLLSGRVQLNANPTAATPVSPADNATFDSGAAQPVVFTHNDPDGDQSSSWRIRYRPAGTSVAYQFLTGTAVVANGANITASVPANTWNGQVEYASQTYDPSGAEGAWSATRTATGVPAALAALTGGQGGTSLHAPTVLNMVQSERALRALSLV